MLGRPRFCEHACNFCLDLYPRVGELLEAFCKNHNTIKPVHMYYVAVCENQTDLAWLLQTVADTLAKTYEESGNTPYGNLDNELKEELLEPVTKRPDMNKLVYGGEPGSAVCAHCMFAKSGTVIPTLTKSLPCGLTPLSYCTPPWTQSPNRAQLNLQRSAVLVRHRSRRVLPLSKPKGPHI